MNGSGQPEVAVVVATHNRPERLRGLLAALAAQKLGTDRFEAVVVDDGSDGRTAAVLESAPPGLRLTTIRNEAARGPAVARNQGWQVGGAALVAFTDDDCEPDPGWLEALLEAHRKDPEALIQGRTGPIVAELGAYGPFGRTKVIDRPTIYFQTCNIAYPRELLERLGGFDEAFPEPAGEDADLGWRALEAGRERVFAPAALVSHAVDDDGPLGYVRSARRGPTSMPAMRRHPRLRSLATYRRFFWHRNHPLALLGVAGVVTAALLTPWTALAIVPWARTWLGRNGQAGGAPWHLPLHPAFDLVEIWATVRHAARIRVLIL